VFWLFSVAWPSSLQKSDDIFLEKGAGSRAEENKLEGEGKKVFD